MKKNISLETEHPKIKAQYTKFSTRPIDSASPFAIGLNITAKLLALRVEAHRLEQEIEKGFWPNKPEQE